MGGASSEIADDDDRGPARGGLLHPDGHRPHLQAPRPAHRGLGPLRARRRPVGDRAVGARASASCWPRACPGSQVADGMLDVRGDVPEPFVVSVPIARVHRQIGVALGPAEIARLIEPIGFTVLEQERASGRRRADRRGADEPPRRPARALRGRRRHRGDRPHVRLLQRAAPGADVAPAGPPDARCSAPGARSRTCCAAWARRRAGPTPSCRRRRTTTWISSARPCGWPTRSTPRSRSCAAPCCPGLLGALAYNASRRQPDVRLFEVGVVFSHPGAGMARVVERSGAGGTERAELPGERELLSAVFAREEDDARCGGGGLARPGGRAPPRRGAPGPARVTARRRCPACTRPARRTSWLVRGSLDEVTDRLRSGRSTPRSRHGST